MAKYEYLTKGVCSKKINFELDDNNELRNLKFQGGCPGNLNALSVILDGMDANKIISLLEGNPCGNRQSSCADQLAKALKLALKNKEKEEK